MVLRAPFRRTSPNLQRPFLLGFFTFPSFASFVCFRAHLLLRFKKSFICLEDLLLRLFFASFFLVVQNILHFVRAQRERFALGSWHIESVSFVMKRGASPPPLPSLGGGTGGGVSSSSVAAANLVGGGAQKKKKHKTTTTTTMTTTKKSFYSTGAANKKKQNQRDEEALSRALSPRGHFLRN